MQRRAGACASGERPRLLDGVGRGARGVVAPPLLALLAAGGRRLLLLRRRRRGLRAISSCGTWREGGGGEAARPRGRRRRQRPAAGGCGHAACHRRRGHRPAGARQQRWYEAHKTRPSQPSWAPAAARRARPHLRERRGAAAWPPAPAPARCPWRRTSCGTQTPGDAAGGWPTGGAGPRSRRAPTAPTRRGPATAPSRAAAGRGCDTGTGWRETCGGSSGCAWRRVLSGRPLAFLLTPSSASSAAAIVCVSAMLKACSATRARAAAVSCSGCRVLWFWPTVTCPVRPPTPLARPPPLFCIAENAATAPFMAAPAPAPARAGGWGRAKAASGLKGPAAAAPQGSNAGRCWIDAQAQPCRQRRLAAAPRMVVVHLPSLSDAPPAARRRSSRPPDPRALRSLPPAAHRLTASFLRRPTRRRAARRAGAAAGRQERGAGAVCGGGLLAHLLPQQVFPLPVAGGRRRVAQRPGRHPGALPRGGASRRAAVRRSPPPLAAVSAAHAPPCAAQRRGRPHAHAHVLTLPCPPAPTRRFVRPGRSRRWRSATTASSWRPAAAWRTWSSACSCCAPTSTPRRP